MPETQSTAPEGVNTSKLILIEDGEWAGWHKWASEEPFEDHAGPFYVRWEDGKAVAGFRVQPKNLNGWGNCHGGALLTFADYALFMIAENGGPVGGVTVTMSSEFVGPGRAGALLTAKGEVTRKGGSLIFVRGTISDGDEPVLTFSATIKKLRG
ncbi:PaaI family thioesterase [Novosphingobium sp.]|uniref:PaaI family thioesterase n=1 Tax=Novosphingobium sp. TaxID=1874826 RepID=UPI0035AFBBAB